ncbi:uncharacterized protein PHALS_14539 [Plasmopara halstedii]|uniref:Uncharacterized protein n=1 Tax=Plasmopara halstedii TaxID=4781 RepID=A0A0P1ALD6_PLAHL|nr:uncharacterized protein PHALS_14539 [Plasmopara halstedii]CEG41528.1 hypothetical protein PHALS_14539 [Plasmopara halstedii]|eukprot:XP_024577897.1 hypothetical protein PHALS_14539 [Plasmopara halstedii]
MWYMFSNLNLNHMYLTYLHELQAASLLEMRRQEKSHCSQTQPTHGTRIKAFVSYIVHDGSGKIRCDAYSERGARFKTEIGVGNDDMYSART